MCCDEDGPAPSGPTYLHSAGTINGTLSQVLHMQGRGPSATWRRKLAKRSWYLSSIKHLRNLPSKWALGYNLSLDRIGSLHSW